MTTFASDLKNFGIAYAVAGTVAHYYGAQTTSELLTVAVACFILALVAYGVGVAMRRPADVE